ncbi:2-C-methyl-D-erythritol 4-phosphate cytidylyltransferase [Bermanella sp. R86510]|uniref:2-C-methyl-D-erythritol 4-phosphate cytidylyltransferase n=1 Tax=unclassified Bermanella TaxID=2627862 RepID=UPI0037CC1782
MSLYAVVPAAGVGKRMGADIPKQYLTLHGQTILEHTLQRLLAFPPIEKIILPIAQHDQTFSQLKIAKAQNLITCDGGHERVDSVLNGLHTLLDNGAQQDDWVMVHDVARPCIAQQDLQNLFAQRHRDGVILGMSVRDTMKRTNAQGQITETVDRALLWHALTPQLAPIGVLINAIEDALAQNRIITDEASALEYAGLQPKIVPGNASNIKVTQPSDLTLVEHYLSLVE